MKKFLLILPTLSLSVLGFSHALDLKSRALLKRMAVEKSVSVSVPEGLQVRAAVGSRSDAPSFLNAFVSLRDGYSVSDLEEAGMKVSVLRGGILAVSVPVDSVEAWASLPCVKKMSLGEPVATNVDLSRTAAGVDAIHRGAGLELPYTGKGVLTGIVDQGLDPNHISFLDESGLSRVRYLSFFNGSTDRYGYPDYELYGQDLYYNDADGNLALYPPVSSFKTDDPSSFHGTHTMNVLAGSYRDNPYYGVATQADIAASCGDLSDVGIAMGINGILDYAAFRRQVDGVPSVLSLSLGSTSGAHDTDGIMNRFLEACGEETVIVISSGNEGDLKLAARKSFSKDDNTLTSMIYPYNYRYSPGVEDEYNTYIRTGAVTVYSSDATPFTLRAVVLAGEDGNFKKRASLDISSESGSYYASDASYAGYVDGAVNSTVGRYFDGYIGGGTLYDEELGRYYGIFDYYLFTKPETGINADGTEAVIVGFEVVGADGQSVECFCDGSNTWISDYGIEGYTDGSRDGTISDMAVGRNIIVVGAYTLRNSLVNLDGSVFDYSPSDGFIKGDIGQYSSFGTMPDGRTLPHVCAPGTGVVSAVSSHYVDNILAGNDSFIAATFQAKASEGGKDYYWTAETGTSMSAPFVAGSIALWLEADPSLGFEDVLDVIRKTSVSDEYVENGNPVQWGAGKFDALEGLKEVIRRRAERNGINSVSADGHNDRLILSPAGASRFRIFVGEAASLDVKVYSPDGSVVYSSGFPGCETDLDLSSLTHGIYIVAVNRHSAKIKI